MIGIGYFSKAKFLNKTWNPLVFLFINLFPPPKGSDISNYFLHLYQKQLMCMNIVPVILPCFYYRLPRNISCPRDTCCYMHKVQLLTTLNIKLSSYSLFIFFRTYLNGSRKRHEIHYKANYHFFLGSHSSSNAFLIHSLISSS